ncbi:bifunctional riboflavin kinase/FAD synthetase [Halosquirtibacter laminarini]|uniref:Bifunctional riboflavin kinase/FAD synthetase n=1 Tax=Halosquirtibacter laminarini TaxID=3374600 RepID=A0AC61NCZ2_9BACT|nr:bifunctional riboflavin kinase/FAD synthetase [Prolixibacteraceae bacterium]
MEIIYHLESFEIPNAAITVGTFDGVHLGHQYLISHLVQEARTRGLCSVVFTFDPYPQEVFSKDPSHISILSSQNEKIRKIESLGVDYLVFFPFSRDFASLTAEMFIENILVEKLSLRFLLLGYDHKFGKDQVSEVAVLERYGDQYGFQLSRLGQKRVSDYNLSSSLIRKKIESGDLLHMKELLGEYYAVSGSVVYGKQIGRQIKFPTANIAVDDPRKLIPKVGVYAILIHYNGIVYKGMLNIGIRPTLNEQKPTCSIEAHIFDFNQDIYGKNLQIDFVQRVRDEIRFDSLDDLVLQLNRDKTACLELLTHME